jgi:preprotein translocase subunit SecE
MSTDEKLDSQPKRRRWRRGQQEEVVEAAVEDDELDDEAEEDARSLTAPKGRATPGRRQQQQVEVEERGSALTRPFYRLGGFLRDVRSELAKVTWPTREETFELTRVVLGTTVAAALILGVIALIFTELFRLGLGQPLIFVGVFIIIIALAVFFLRRSDQRSTPY